MRKCLGVFAAAVVFCVISWAQTTPAQTPAPESQPAPAAETTQTPAPDAPQAAPATPAPQEPLPSRPAPPKAPPKFYPRIEWSGGYSFAQAGFFNAGHWAQLNGWYGSFGLNAASWMGLVVEGSQFFGNSKIPTATPAPFPNCLNDCPSGSTFNADTREYNVLFGLQFPYRKYERWTPFAELMYGHDGIRGQATLGTLYSEVSSGGALLAGGGVDRKISNRFSLRFKADYLQTRSDFRLMGKTKQENLRLSVGIVIHSVRKKKRSLEDETDLEP